MTIELARGEAEELLNILRMVYSNHELTKIISNRLAGDVLIEFPPEPVEEKPVAEWKELSTAEIKALWNVTKKPSEFASLLLAKVKEKNYEWRP
jgi:hypothetical protein